MSAQTTARVLLVLGCALARATVVQAYSGAQNFSFPAAAGGGGGRYFTGSPLDSYTCKACHGGGEATPLRVLGLPLTGYQPETDYELTVLWPASVDHLSAALEITDMAGRRAGLIRLPDQDETQTPELCLATDDETLAAQLLRVPPADKRDEPGYCGADGELLPSDCRSVINVRDCGSGRVRFLWSSPSWDVGPLWFAGAAVRSNVDGDVTGDGVTDFGRVIPSPAHDSGVLSAHASGCAAVDPGQRAGAGWAILTIAALWARRRRAQR